MIFTVTLNPAVDKTVVIPDFKAGTVNRIQCIRQDAGGKGLNVSKCLEAMNEPSTRFCSPAVLPDNILKILL